MFSESFTKEISREDLRDLYDSVGWTTYTRDPNKLARAIQQSTFVASIWSDRMLVGLARCISDDESIAYLQDILVHPSLQRQGIGKRLIQACLQRFSHCDKFVILTDDEPWQHSFYSQHGLRNAKQISNGFLNTFVKFRD